MLIQLDQMQYLAKTYMPFFEFEYDFPLYSAPFVDFPGNNALFPERIIRDVWSIVNLLTSYSLPTLGALRNTFLKLSLSIRLLSNVSYMKSLQIL